MHRTNVNSSQHQSLGDGRPALCSGSRLVASVILLIFSLITQLVFIENGRVLCYSAGLESYRPAGQLIFELQPTEVHKVYAVAHIGDILLTLNGGPEPSNGLSIDLATEQVVDVWAPNNGSFIDAHDIAIAPESRSFFVTQLGRGDQRARLVKFNLIETKLSR